MTNWFTKLTSKNGDIESGKNPGGALSSNEKSIAKRLLLDGRRAQDILALLNIGRDVTTNSGRISGLEKNANILPCEDEELGRFYREKQSFDLKTGLSIYQDERLIRAREAMVLAVQVFNSPSHAFKAEAFSMLANVAWTYLCHQRFLSLGNQISTEQGQTISLSDLVSKNELGLSDAIQSNFNDIKKIRDQVEHRLLEKSDSLWFGLFQASFLNFDKTMCDWFGDCMTLSKELSLSIQFSKPAIDQLASVVGYDIPETMIAFNADLKSHKSQAVLENTEYEFSVVYTTVQGSNSKHHYKFISPRGEAAQEINNVLIKHKAAALLHPYKPSDVVQLVNSEVTNQFTMHNLTAAWKNFKYDQLDRRQSMDKLKKTFATFTQRTGTTRTMTLGCKN